MSSQNRYRQVGLSVTLWAFGFATTLLLIGMWGRSTSADEATLTQSARAVVTTDLVRDRVAEWVDAELAAAGLGAIPAGTAVDRILAIDAVGDVVDGLIAESVAALVAQDEAAMEIDVAAAMLPVAPLIAEELSVDPAVVADALAGIDPIDLGDETSPVSTTAAAVHGVLALIVLLAAAAMVAFGAASVALSDDRKAMLRGLAIRVALSAFSFGLLFQIGGWLIDPNGGRSPVLTGSSILIRSNGHVFLIVALAATVAAAVVTLSLMSRRRPLATDDRDDTRELVSV